MNQTPLDIAALSRLKTKESTQADLLRELLTVSGESYILTRLRALEARGLIKKEKRGSTNTRTLIITEAGLAILKDMDTPRRPPTPGQGTV